MKHLHKALIISGFILFGILIASYFIITRIAENKIEEYLHTYLEKIAIEQKLEDYLIKTGEVKVRLLGRRAYIKDVHLLEKASGREFISIAAAGVSNLHLKFVNKKPNIDLERIHFLLDETKVILPGNLYTLAIESAEFDMQQKGVKIRDIAFSSIVPKWEFAHKDPKHSDWFDVQIKSIDIRGLKVDSLVNSRRFYADSLLLDDAALSNYKNAQIPIPHNYMPMIYTVVQRLPLKFHLSFVHVTNLDVTYEELAEKEKKPGRITLTDMDGIFHDYTNIITSPKQTTLLEASGKLMGEGKFNAQVVLPVDSAYDFVSLDIHLGAMSMISLNPIIENMAPAKIESGFIQGGDFYIRGSSKRSSIKMKLLYNDLSVDILVRTGNHKSEVGLLSFFANGLLARDNPHKGDDVRIITAEHERDPLHSSFNYLWKTIFAALEEVLGYTDERQKIVKWVKEELF